jgi:hypothetical protein
MPRVTGHLQPRTNWPTWASQEYATNFHSVNVSAVIFKDNSNITLISMSVGEPPKSQAWEYDRKKKD